MAYPYGKNIFSVNGSQKLGQIADSKGIFYWRVLTPENPRVHGQLKRETADFTHIFSVSTLDAILLLRHACFRKDMYDVHRFDTRNILWQMGMQLKKYT